MIKDTTILENKILDYVRYAYKCKHTLNEYVDNTFIAKILAQNLTVIQLYNKYYDANISKHSYLVENFSYDAMIDSIELKFADNINDTTVIYAYQMTTSSLGSYDKVRNFVKVLNIYDSYLANDIIGFYIYRRKVSTSYNYTLPMYENSLIKKLFTLK